MNRKKAYSKQEKKNFPSHFAILWRRHIGSVYVGDPFSGAHQNLLRERLNFLNLTPKDQETNSMKKLCEIRKIVDSDNNIFNFYEIFNFILMYNCKLRRIGYVIKCQLWSCSSERRQLQVVKRSFFSLIQQLELICWFQFMDISCI